MRQLASLLPVASSGVVINAVSPGLCYTDLDRNASRPAKLVLATMRTLLARTAEEGSRTLLYAALAGPDSHGAYCSECRVKKYVSLPPLPYPICVAVIPEHAESNLPW